MEWFVTIVIVVPAALLALVRSSWLLDYAIIVLAFNRCIRRLVDYYSNGAFNPLSPISLTPLIVAGLLLLPALSFFKRLPSQAARPMMFLVGAVGLGLTVGLVKNHAAAVYSLAEWGAGLSAMAFAASHPAPPAKADRWLKTAGWAGIGVAAYGWWQYFTIPPWDAMWLVQSGMAGYMGQPEPMMMTMFSTMNERGPCGTFLAWAVIPMILSKRWRNIGGWVSVALILSAIFMTETRSNLLVIGAVALLFPAVTKGRGILSLFALTAIFAAVVNYGMSKLPGFEEKTKRYESNSLYGEGSSLKGRLEIYRRGLVDVGYRPLGLGLGSSGMGRRTEGDEVENVGDSGYLQILAQFGWIGAFLFFAALWLLWKELSVRWTFGSKRLNFASIDPFIPATRALLLGVLVFLFVTDIFAGFSMIWVFFGRALNPTVDPRRILRQQLASRALARKIEEAVNALQQSPEGAAS